ncbi:MAG TPA: CBS domain-containing protein, partial [Vicinamibacterales bacterium]|nr:CBS domain-containing protein [Vicinamibacterales bacterium]
MRVYEIMSPSVKTIATTALADDAWEVMRGERIHHLVVMDGKRVAGVFSARDAGGAKGAKIREGRRVDELMSEHVVTADKKTTLKRVANLMRGHTIGSVVIVDKGKPVGIITTSDLLELLGRGAIRPTPASKRAPLNYRAPHT